MRGALERALRALPGVAAAAVNLATERAELHFDPAQSSGADIAHALDAAGYPPVLAEFSVAVGA